MVNGMSSIGSNYSDYNAFLKSQQKKERFQNNLKHNIAAGAAIGAGAAGIYTANKYADTKVMKTIDKGLTKGAEYLANGGLKETYGQVADYLKNGAKQAKEAAPKMPEMSIPFDKLKPEVQELINKGKEKTKTVSGKVKEFAGGLWDKVKGPLTKGWTKAKTIAADLLNKFAKLPVKYKAAGAIGLITMLALHAISKDKAYNNGKIDGETQI